ncbi:MAG: roadblock/LC7 domain-containing protein [Candidatus Edwardsbacteria bacterium]|jgi:predicted regulator of Ras-like GTPase activity (Roadblock/LC7/MglB family)|nr:roadblock/LC7 domain-containing protein [Candidatus Edwardsbacteria bacterium]
MPKEPAELVDSVLRMEGVRHSCAVSKDDGSVIKSSDGAPGNFGEVTAFLGSAAEVIASNLVLGDLSAVLAEGEGHKLLIMPQAGAYLGVEIDPAASPWWATQQNPLDLLSEDKMAEISEAEELLKQKVILLNLLLEDFGAKGEKAPEWKEMLEKEVKAVDPAGRLARMLDIGTGIIVPRSGVKTDITKKEVGDAFEKLVNLTCKKAISILGFVEVKQKFQSVITRLAADRR